MINHKSSGVVRFDINHDKTIIGILLTNKYRGQNLASKVLSKASRLYFQTNTTPIYAYIKKDNIGSVKSFEKSGYNKVSEEKINEIDSFIYKLEENEIR